MEIVDDASLTALRERLAEPLDAPFIVHARIDGTVVSPWFAALVDGAARFVAS